MTADGAPVGKIIMEVSKLVVVSRVWLGISYISYFPGWAGWL